MMSLQGLATICRPTAPCDYVRHPTVPHDVLSGRAQLQRPSTRPTEIRPQASYVGPLAEYVGPSHLPALGYHRGAPGLDRGDERLRE